VAQIATASNEQNQGIQQVNTAVTQVDKVTQTNAASAEESANASEELNAQVATFKDGVAQLLALVGGQAQSRSPAQASSQVREDKRLPTAVIA
jgi:methyl-accepting chemotaxis protein